LTITVINVAFQYRWRSTSFYIQHACGGRLPPPQTGPAWHLRFSIGSWYVSSCSISVRCARCTRCARYGISWHPSNSQLQLQLQLMG